MIGFLPLRRPVVLLIIALAALTACARPTAPLGGGNGWASRSAFDARGESARGSHAAAPRPFSFAGDTFAFPNMIRARHHGEPDLYANYCFVMARAVRQFFVAARFDADAPRLSHAEYVARVRQIVAHPPWEPRAAAERVAIPGYRDLREFSGGEETAVKEGLGPKFWTLVHWTNWRVTLPVTGAHQANVAREIVDELQHGRLVQLLITNWPKPELNHTVVAFAAREVPAGVALDVSDPNNPDEPGIITFDRVRRRFEATRVYDTEPGVIRVFRMYYSRLL